MRLNSFQCVQFDLICVCRPEWVRYIYLSDLITGVVIWTTICTLVTAKQAEWHSKWGVNGCFFSCWLGVVLLLLRICGNIIVFSGWMGRMVQFWGRYLLTRGIGRKDSLICYSDMKGVSQVTFCYVAGDRKGKSPLTPLVFERIFYIFHQPDENDSSLSLYVECFHFLFDWLRIDHNHFRFPCGK